MIRTDVRSLGAALSALPGSPLHDNDAVAITAKLRVVREEAQRLQQGLGDQEPIERIIVVARQPIHRGRVDRGDRKELVAS